MYYCLVEVHHLVRSMPCLYKETVGDAVKCGLVGHYTSVCKKTKDDEVTANSVQIMHSTMSTINVNLCQFKVGNKIEYDKAIRKQLHCKKCHGLRTL